MSIRVLWSIRSGDTYTAKKLPDILAEIKAGHIETRKQQEKRTGGILRSVRKILSGLFFLFVAKVSIGLNYAARREYYTNGEYSILLLCCGVTAVGAQRTNIVSVKLLCIVGCIDTGAARIERNKK